MKMTNDENKTENKPIDHITILRCREPGKKAVKEWTVQEDGTIEKVSFNAGKIFMREREPVSSLDDTHNVLKNLALAQEKFVIRAEPKDGAQSAAARRIHGDGAAFEQKDRYWLTLDMDKINCPAHIDPAKNPEEAAEWVRSMLPPPFNTTACIFKFSSSQNVPPKKGGKSPSKISVHLWYWCDRAVSEQEWKRFFKAHPCPVDQALFSPVQIHYTADPVFNGMDDPLPKRLGILKGDTPVLHVPPIPDESVQKPRERVDKVPSVPEDDISKAIDMLLPYYDEGGRDRFAGAIAGALYRGGWPADETADFVYRLADAAGDEEAQSRFDSALRICDAIDNNRPAQGIPTLRDEFEIEDLEKILALLGVGKPDIAAKIVDLSKSSTAAEIENVVKGLLPLPVSEQEIYIEEIKKQTGQSKGAINRIFNALRREETLQSSLDHAVLLVSMLMQQDYGGGRFFLRTIDGNFWLYNGTHWETETEDSIKKRLIPIANELYVPGSTPSVSAMVNAALNLLEGQAFRRGDPLRLNSAPLPILNCRNGELWFDEGGNPSFRPHAPESFLRHCLDVDYDPEATSPQFDKAIRDIFSKSYDPEEMCRHMLEIMAYICQPWRKIPVILLLHGSGSNGKTSLVKILENFLGTGHYMADRLNEVEDKPFKIGALDGKLMLVDDDVDAGAYLPDGFLKKISEEKTMTGQHKHKPLFEFKCRAVPVMLANHYPSIKDLSEGLRRRLLVVPFQRQFTKDEIIPGLFEDIWAKEASGILNQIIAAFQRLKERGRFDEPKDCLDAKTAWITRSNVLVTFIEEACLQGPEQNQAISDFYSLFKEYCEKTGVRNIPTRQGVKNRLENMGYDLTILNGLRVVRGLYCPEFGDVCEEVNEVSDAEASELPECSIIEQELNS